MEGFKIGNGVVIMGSGDGYVDVRVSTDEVVTQTSGGNDQTAYAKFPINSATVQITAWKAGTPEARAIALVAKKDMVAKRKVELIKRAKA